MKKEKREKAVRRRRSVLRPSQKRFLWLAGVPVFLLYLYICILPVVQSVCNSFYNWDGYSDKVWAGISNYARILTDNVFRQSVGNDLIIVFFKEIIIVFFAVCFAVALTRIRLRKPEKLILRFLYYIPNILSVIVISMLWKFFFNLGLFDEIVSLLHLGLSSPNGWISDYPLQIIIFVASWCGIGSFMIVLITAINNISAEVYEAADIDGAGQLRQLFSITLPAIMPQVRYVIVTILTGSLAVNLNLVLPFTGGGPGTRSMVMGLYVYKYAYDYYEVGYANAAAVLLMLISVILASVVNFLILRKEDN